MTEVKDPFAVGEWVVCVKEDWPLKVGDISCVVDRYIVDPQNWFGARTKCMGVIGMRKSRFRPATPEEIARHLGEKREGMEKQTRANTVQTGGLSGHYLAEVPEPQRGGSSYTAECDDIIFALNMTFDEGEAFKAIWRTCTSRLGYGKEGNTALYNAQKLVHRAGRILKRAEKGE